MPRRFPRPELAVTGLMFADGTGAETIIDDEAPARPSQAEVPALASVSGEIDAREPVRRRAPTA